MPANSAPTFKGIKIYSNDVLLQNGFYVDVSEVIIEEWNNVLSFQLLTSRRVGMSTCSYVVR